MKLDKIAFAKLINFVAAGVGRELSDGAIEELDRLIDIPVSAPFVSIKDTNDLIAAMNQPGKKIEAIKAYRSLTGAGLKEAKDAVERYWKENKSTADGDNFYTN